MKLSPGENEVPQSEGLRGFDVPEDGGNGFGVMSGIRSNLRRVLPFVLTLMASCGGAAGTVKSSDVLERLGVAEKAYDGAKSEALALDDAARAARQRADAAAQARLQAAQVLAGTLGEAEKLREAQAREFRDRKCGLNPGLCVNPEVVQPAFVDVKIEAFGDGGISRLPGSSYPSGWEITFANGKFILFVNGQPKVAISDPSAVGKCFRFTTDGVSEKACQ
ncbi:hypothetical protein HZA40_05230 [Candidatus Peregrinibacteria bacterium]|nr:hypothetical protein [Candidatus Peregrinibacteria bacterium]